jgi:hypothetical protein
MQQVIDVLSVGQRKVIHQIYHTKQHYKPMRLYDVVINCKCNNRIKTREGVGGGELIPLLFTPFFVCVDFFVQLMYLVMDELPRCVSFVCCYCHFLNNNSSAALDWKKMQFPK